MCGYTTFSLSTHRPNLKGACLEEERQRSLYLTAHCGLSSLLLVIPTGALTGRQGPSRESSAGPHSWLRPSSCTLPARTAHCCSVAVDPAHLRAARCNASKTMQVWIGNDATCPCHIVVGAQLQLGLPSPTLTVPFLGYRQVNKAAGYRLPREKMPTFSLEESRSPSPLL